MDERMIKLDQTKDQETVAVPLSEAPPTTMTAETEGEDKTKPEEDKTNKTKDKKPETLVETSLEDASLLQELIQLKTQGIEHDKRQEWDKAIQAFTTCIDRLPVAHRSLKVKETKEDGSTHIRPLSMAMLLTNRSAVLLKQGQIHSALQDADKAVMNDMSWWKAWARRGEALAAQLHALIHHWSQQDQQDRPDRQQQQQTRWGMSLSDIQREATIAFACAIRWSEDAEERKLMRQRMDEVKGMDVTLHSVEAQIQGKVQAIPREGDGSKEKQDGKILQEQQQQQEKEKEKEKADKQTQDFLAWLKRNKVVFQALDICVKDGVRGVQTNRPIRPKQCLMSIPPECIMSSDQSTSQSSWVKRLDLGVSKASENQVDTDKNQHMVHLMLAVWLLEERHKSLSSYWAPYLAMLPQTLAEFMPLYYCQKDSAEWNMLHRGGCQHILRDLDTSRNDMQQSYKDLIRRWQKEQMQIKDNEPAGVGGDAKETKQTNETNESKQTLPFTLDEWIWARLIVSSRAFGFTKPVAPSPSSPLSPPSPVTSGKDYKTRPHQTRIDPGKSNTDTDTDTDNNNNNKLVHVTGLVPLADMLNHQMVRPTTTADTQWAFDAARNAFVVTAQTHLRSGEQVLDTYGKKSNRRLFLSYGFTLAENVDNDALFELMVAEGEPPRHVLMTCRHDSKETKHILDAMRQRIQSEWMAIESRNDTKSIQEWQQHIKMSDGDDNDDSSLFTQAKTKWKTVLRDPQRDVKTLLLFSPPTATAILPDILPPSSTSHLAHSARARVKKTTTPEAKDPDKENKQNVLYAHVELMVLCQLEQAAERGLQQMAGSLADDDHWFLQRESDPMLRAQTPARQFHCMRLRRGVRQVYLYWKQLFARVHELCRMTSKQQHKTLQHLSGERMDDASAYLLDIWKPMLMSAG